VYCSFVDVDALTARVLPQVVDGLMTGLSLEVLEDHELAALVSKMIGGEAFLAEVTEVELCRLR
jgi:hypothetical protein